MQAAVAETGLTITNPLVLYRALVATKKIEPDPAQHRLAIHLQKLYHRLKDYEPSIEYRHRLEQVARAVGSSVSPPPSPAPAEDGSTGSIGGLFRSFRAQREQADSLALTRTLTSHEAALQMRSPQGLLLYGEVGTGKSFLVDLLAESLPSRKKRRYHFNTFMLEMFSRLEQQRIERSVPIGSSRGLDHEHTLLSVAKDLVTTSPILFLDEFQLPDRASSKILSNLFTSFFQLGGVLVATSNRMPEELSKASGAEFAAPAMSSNRTGFSGLRRMFGVSVEESGRGMFSKQSDFTQFLEVLKARCETWNMESKTDFRRRDSATAVSSKGSPSPLGATTSEATGHSAQTYKLDHETAVAEGSADILSDHDKLMPAFFFQSHSDLLSAESLEAESVWHASVLGAVALSKLSLSEIPWQLEHLNVYGRKVPVPKSHNGVCMWTFEQLCGTYLGPADYITLASTYHTIIMDEVPVLNLLQKNEARRFITLLDALYEARCKLLIRADAGPDELFFPDARGLNKTDGNSVDTRDDGVYAETFSEIYQDTTTPFRPNISSYGDAAPDERFASSTSLSVSGAHPATRSILADEDADFGPVYGAGRSAGASSFDPVEEDRLRILAGQVGPNFQRSDAFTGEDEKFAYKRAESRLWELCSQRWWDNALGSGWWRPLGKEARSWEENITLHEVNAVNPADSADMEAEKERIFRHGASPFRTHQDPPPKIPWTHTWGMVKWGQKAGIWGKGAEGVEERQEEKRREKEMMDRIKPKPRP